MQSKGKQPRHCQLKVKCQKKAGQKGRQTHETRPNNTSNKHGQHSVKKTTCYYRSKKDKKERKNTEQKKTIRHCI